MVFSANFKEFNKNYNFIFVICQKFLQRIIIQINAVFPNLEEFQQYFYRTTVYSEICTILLKITEMVKVSLILTYIAYKLQIIFYIRNRFQFSIWPWKVFSIFRIRVRVRVRKKMSIRHFCKKHRNIVTITKLLFTELILYLQIIVEHVYVLFSEIYFQQQVSQQALKLHNWSESILKCKLFSF